MAGQKTPGKKASPVQRQALKVEKTTSQSASPSLEALMQARISRRSALRGGLGLATTTIFAGAGVAALTGCSDSDDDSDDSSTSTMQLGFSSVDGSDVDALTVPEGYIAEILAPWGTPILGSLPAFATDGSGSTNSAAEQAMQMGQNHDGMHYFPLSQSDPSSRGLLVMNHEYSNSTLFPGGARSEDVDGKPTDPEQVRKDINAHGVAIIEIERNGEGQVSLVSGSGFNRRITAATPMLLSGPAAGSSFMVTAYDNSGMTTRGTVNNCAHGYTPWGTYLACEENIQGYFITNEATPPREKDRMGINDAGFGYFWNNVAGDASEVNGEFARFDTTPGGGDATGDYRNEANTFGWIVEIDPRNPSAMPIKRTAMGRFRHEGCTPGRVVEGQKIAFYMGDDSRFEYFYKFVTDDNYDPDRPSPNMLDNGTLFVAKFNEDGTGAWLPVDYSNAALATDFVSQADVMVNTRSAADVLGATPMDRPEWTATDPNTGEIYLTLTNNTQRVSGDENAPNPRADNSHGHVVRLAEDGDDPAATGFTWDIFVFGSNANADSAFNISGLDASNEFGSPDGIWFDSRGILWIQTDNGAPLDFGQNDQMLAVIPANLDGDRVITPDNNASLRRFFVGPVGCEVTGVDMTPDNRTMFVNIQHPGGHWPQGGSAVPRSSTVVIRREDGGEIGT